MLATTVSARINPAEQKVTARQQTLGAFESLQITSNDPAPPPVYYIKSSGGLFKDMTIHDFDMAR